VQHDGVADRSRHRRDGVERRRQGHGAGDRYQPRRALEADQTLQRGGDPDRAVGVGAERSPGGAGGDGGGAARGRAARDAGHWVEAERRRIGQHREVRIEADSGERELGHVRAADQGRAGAAQPGDCRCVFARGQGVAQDHRAGPGGLPGDVEQVLDRDGQAGEQTGVAAGSDRPIGGGRGSARYRKGSRDERGPGARGPGGVDRALDRFARREVARNESPARFGQVVGHRNAIISRFTSSGRSARLPVFMGETRATGRGSRSIREPASSMVSRRRIGQPIPAPAIRAGF